MGASGTCPQLATTTYDCRHFVTKVPLKKGPNKATKVQNCRRFVRKSTESDLKPPFESPHLDFPEPKDIICGVRCASIALGQKSCRRKVPRIYRIFVLNFVPNFAPNLLRISLCFVFPWKRRPLKISLRTPGIFHCQIPRQFRRNNPHKFSGEQAK